MNNAEKREYVLTSEECDYIEKLIAKNEAVVRNTIRMALGEEFERLGEDCISELYLLMCEKIDTLKEHRYPDGWIVIAAKKIAYGILRKDRVRSGFISAERTRNIRAGDDVFENALYNIWMEDGVIDKLLASLTPHELEIYDYLYHKRLTAKKTAEILGLSASTVRNIDASIRRKIQKGINEDVF